MSDKDEEKVGKYFETENVFISFKKFLPKFFGCVTLYLVGYFNFSMAWIVTPLVLIFLKTFWKKGKNRQNVGAKVAALLGEQKMIKNARIPTKDLPSWVIFPDKVFTINVPSSL